jgi:hypothetical protein
MCPLDPARRTFLGCAFGVFTEEYPKAVAPQTIKFSNMIILSASGIISL